MDFEIGTEWRIPMEPGQAVSAGWPAFTEHRPVAVTWHWTATRSLDRCNTLLGGREAVLKGRASAHLGIGRSFSEGVESYVSLEHRSWHAGRLQTLRWDGQAMTEQAEKGSRTSIGIETVNRGFARPQAPESTDTAAILEEAAEVVAEPDWIRAHSVDGARFFLVEPWSEEQMLMMIEVGKQVVRRWPHLGPRDHHGHHDLCPGYKVDVAGFPFARVLRGIYNDSSLPDVWTSVWTVGGRRRVLGNLGFGSLNAVESEFWTRADDLNLRRCQRALSVPETGWWTTAMSWAAQDAGGFAGL